MNFHAPLSLRPTVDCPLPSCAMVLAAGLGTRMRPLTLTRPKPLVEVAGRTLLDHALDRLEASGIRHAVVNTHYLADALEEHLRVNHRGMEISISDERSQLLETGGGIARALPLIPCDPFISVNSDNLWIDGPVDSLRELARRWDGARMDALLLLVPSARANNHGGRGDFHMDANGRLKRRLPGRHAPFVYTGIQMLAKRLFDGAPSGAFSMNLLWDRAIAEGRAWGAVHNGLWFDVGTPEAVTRTAAVIADA